MIDVREPTESYSAGDFARDAVSAIDEARRRGARPVICGGSGLYVSALVDGLHEAAPADLALRSSHLERAALLERLARIDAAAAESFAAAPLPRIMRAIEMTEATGKTLAEIRAVPRSSSAHRYRIFVIEADRADLYRRINERVTRMIAAGLVDEVKALRADGVERGMPSQRAIGYREIHRLLDGELDLDEAIALVQRNTRRYAKRQDTWNRRWTRGE